MLKLPLPSPPVPTISASPAFEIGSGVFCLSKAFAQPVISLTEGPFAAIAVRIAAVTRSSSVPSVRFSINSDACSSERSFFAIS